MTLEDVEGIFQNESKEQFPGIVVPRLWRDLQARTISWLGNVGTILKEFYNSFCEFGKN